ncbi:MAG TPA: ParB/RepB/Spo0J family partition protein [Isosphaeraceae bacterium]|nr:ParB/RepB/Spo0J family partition protein [Isosphaeraceae bacterium]
MDGQDPSYAGSGSRTTDREAPPQPGAAAVEDATIAPSPGGPAQLGGVDSRVVGVGRRPGATGRPADAGILRRVAIADIAIAPGRRSVNRDWLDRLARSIAAEGLYVPIIVRAREAGRKPFELVAGRHRLAACKELGWAEIDARVLELDDQMAEMAAVTENLWCMPLKRKQFEGALARWEALYQLRYPETMQHRAGGVALARKREAAKRAADGAPGEVAEGADGSSGQAASFADLVAGRLGVSKRTAQRALKRSRVFRDEDRETFEQCSVTTVQQDAIAAIKDPERRAQCVWDIGQRLDPAEAIARHAETRRGGRAAGGPKDPEAALADVEWLVEYCGRLRDRLSDPGAYESDALLYRKVDKHRRKFAAGAEGLLGRGEPRNRGAFERLVRKIIDVAHPGDWRLCDTCWGTGFGPDRTTCRKCATGYGYLLSYEERG